MVAGEASGDLLAGLLLDGLQARWPEVRAQGATMGIGGPQMLRRGFEAWWPSEKLAVSGYVEVLRRYRELVGIRDQLRQRLLRERPDVFIGVDAPDFNLDLERSLRDAGIKTAHFVCPSIWAWRPERVHKIKASVDHVLCIFPFEVELLAQHGIAATYVGHPLANVIPRVPDRAAARAGLGLPPDAPVVAVLPGSRASEIKHLAERFFEAAALMKHARPDLHVIVPAAPGRRAAIEQAARRVFGAKGHANFHVLEGQSHQALAACDVTLIASGTATLEAALFKRPMVVAYAVHWLTAWIMRGKKLQPWISLPNILCRDFVVPELLQDEAPPEKLAAATLAWLDDPARVAAVQARFDALHAELQRDTPTLAADAIAQILPA
ncbi:lipid-A-disaccharide synthase [Hylemonella gracilis]|uniref:Lipid-A-disaccharide synthase n=1 Tax=Hylemonella gracilis TaxID=80880 RepID=A0A4P6UQR3_9BURK|nr:lipid-A-disaccharide synthase [Hylemonella gracilis]QBK06507.1 lipid-A-disaccharide synthase [Hylemonella gracilis]